MLLDEQCHTSNFDDGTLRSLEESHPQQNIMGLRKMLNTSQTIKCQYLRWEKSANWMFEFHTLLVKQYIINKQKQKLFKITNYLSNCKNYIYPKDFFCLCSMYFFKPSSKNLV